MHSAIIGLSFSEESDGKPFELDRVLSNTLQYPHDAADSQNQSNSPDRQTQDI